MSEPLNKFQAKIESAFEQTGEPKLFSFEWMLKYLSFVYGLVVWVRSFLYEKKILQQKSLPCFVISVGNIVAGGAGKTPMTLYLAEILKKMGKTPVIVSRGYKGDYEADALVVSDGKQLFSSAEECGDEPYMMAQKKICPVMVGKDRFKAGRKAMQKFNPDIIILDDGFQHLKLKRDLDLLLFDCLNPLGNSRLLPAGRLRETPLMAAKRAHGLIFTRCTNGVSSKENPHIEILINNFEAVPWFKTTHAPFISRQEGCMKKDQNQAIEIESLNRKKALLFSGLAKNTSFCRTMEECGVNIVHHLEFQDHYRYKESDFERINSKAVELDAELILTTEKDWAKTGPDIKWKKEVVVIGIRIEFESPVDFQNFLEQRLN